jgi:hypothetical protein
MNNYTRPGWDRRPARTARVRAGAAPPAPPAPGTAIDGHEQRRKGTGGLHAAAQDVAARGAPGASHRLGRRTAESSNPDTLRSRPDCRRQCARQASNAYSALSVHAARRHRSTRHRPQLPGPATAGGTRGGNPQRNANGQRNADRPDGGRHRPRKRGPRRVNEPQCEMFHVGSRGHAIHSPTAKTAQFDRDPSRSEWHSFRQEVDAGFFGTHNLIDKAQLLKFVQQPVELA